MCTYWSFIWRFSQVLEEETARQWGTSVRVQSTVDQVSSLPQLSSVRELSGSSLTDGIKRWCCRQMRTMTQVQQSKFDAHIICKNIPVNSTYQTTLKGVSLTFPAVFPLIFVEANKEIPAWLCSQKETNSFIKVTSSRLASRVYLEQLQQEEMIQRNSKVASN